MGLLNALTGRLNVNDFQADGPWIRTHVNTGGINMDTWQSDLNSIFERGYRLAHVFEQKGNTVMVFERYR